MLQFGKTITFDLVDATNLASPEAGHMRRLVIKILSQDTTRKNGLMLRTGTMTWSLPTCDARSDRKTAMTDSKDLNEQDAVVAEVDIAAPPERVFEALTEANQLFAWWSTEPSVELSLFEMDARVGGRWRFQRQARAGLRPW